MRRLKVPYREPSNHPQKTVYAMRMLAGIADNQLRASLSHDLYRVRSGKGLRNLVDSMSPVVAAGLLV